MTAARRGRRLLVHQRRECARRSHSPMASTAPWRCRCDCARRGACTACLPVVKWLQPQQSPTPSPSRASPRGSSALSHAAEHGRLAPEHPPCAGCYFTPNACKAVQYARADSCSTRATCPRWHRRRWWRRSWHGERQGFCCMGSQLHTPEKGPGERPRRVFHSRIPVRPSHGYPMKVG